MNDDEADVQIEKLRFTIAFLEGCLEELREELEQLTAPPLPFRIIKNDDDSGKKK